MPNVKRFALPILVALPALAAGVVIGRYAMPPASTSVVAPIVPSAASAPPAATAAPAEPLASVPEPAETIVDPTDVRSAENLISRFKTALARPGGRHTYATF